MEVRNINDGPCESHPLLPKAMLLLPSARMLLCLVESVASCSKTITFLITASTTAVSSSSSTAANAAHSFRSPAADEGGNVTFSCTVCGHDASGVMAMEAYIPCSGISFRKERFDHEGAGDGEEEGNANVVSNGEDDDDGTTSVEGLGGDDEDGQATYCTPGFAVPHSTWLRHWQSAKCPVERRTRKTRNSAYAAQLPRPLAAAHRQVALASIHSSTPWKRPAPPNAEGQGGLGGSRAGAAQPTTSNASALPIVSQTADMTMACRTLSHCLKELLAAKAGIPVDELDRVVAAPSGEEHENEDYHLMVDDDGGDDGGGGDGVANDAERVGTHRGSQAESDNKKAVHRARRSRNVVGSSKKPSRSAASLGNNDDLDLDTPIRLMLTNSHIHVESTDVGEARQYRIVRFLEYQGLWTVGAVRNVLWHRMARKEDVLALFSATNALRTEHSDLVVKPCISADTQRPALTLHMNDVIHNADGTVHTSHVFTGTLDVVDWGGDVVNVGASQWGVDAPPMFRIAEEIRIDPRQFFSFMKPMIGRWRTPGYMEGGWFVSKNAADIRGDDAELFLGFHVRHPIMHVLIQAPKHGVVLMALISGKEG